MYCLSVRHHPCVNRCSVYQLESKTTTHSYVLIGHLTTHFEVWVIPVLENVYILNLSGQANTYPFKTKIMGRFWLRFKSFQFYFALYAQKLFLFSGVHLIQNVLKDRDVSNQKLLSKSTTSKQQHNNLRMHVSTWVNYHRCSVFIWYLEFKSSYTIYYKGFINLFALIRHFKKELF